MSLEFLEYLFSTLEDKNTIDTKPKEVKQNQFDDYFEGTEKLNSKSKFIDDFVIKDEIIGRKFLNKNKEIKYIEIFKNSKLELMGISKNITFIHLYEAKNENLYNGNKFIGFRYYTNEQKASDSQFFTLIKRYDSKYYILEKNKIIKDINGKIFYNSDLDCFSIISYIINQKYRNKNVIMNGETFPEIIGYCYALVSLSKFKEFICIEPLIPEVSKPETLEENIPDELEDNTTYIEPVICDGHISLVIFSKVKGMRFNIILDMSRYHSSSKSLHKSTYPKSVIIQNYIYPKKPIQNSSSCCLWFYGEIECLKNNIKYNNLKSVYDNAKKMEITFYIDIINEIAKNYYDINDLFLAVEKEKDLHENVDLDRLCVKGQKYNYKIHKNIVFTQFLDINAFLFNLCFFDSYLDYKLLIDCQKEIQKYISYRNLLELNYKFNKYIDEKGDSTEILYFIAHQIDIIKGISDKFKEKYELEFLNNNITYYENLKDNSIVLNIPKEKEEILEKFDIDVHINAFNKIYNESKVNSEEFALYSENEIPKKLNPNNEICYNLMNK